MTEDDFLDLYATSNDMTRETMLACGYYASPCSCSWEGCLGWEIAIDLTGDTCNPAEQS